MGCEQGDVVDDHHVWFELAGFDKSVDILGCHPGFALCNSKVMEGVRGHVGNPAADCVHGCFHGDIEDIVAVDASIDSVLAECFGLSRARGCEDGGDLSPDEHVVMVEVLVDADFSYGDLRTVLVLAILCDYGVFPAREIGEYTASEVSVSVYEAIGYNH